MFGVTVAAHDIAGCVEFGDSRGVDTATDGEWRGVLKEEDEMEKGAQWQCRLWWPKHLSRARPPASMALVGWVSYSDSCSLDLVIAATCPMPASQSLQVFFPPPESAYHERLGLSFLFGFSLCG